MSPGPKPTGGLIQLIAHGCSDMWYMSTYAGDDTRPMNTADYNHCYFVNREKGVMTAEDVTFSFNTNDVIVGAHNAQFPYSIKHEKMIPIPQPTAYYP